MGWGSGSRVLGGLMVSRNDVVLNYLYCVNICLGDNAESWRTLIIKMMVEERSLL